MPTTPIHIFSGQKLEPYMAPDEARSIAVRISPSQTLARGTVLGQVTATGNYQAYSAGDSPAGVGVARGIIVFDVISDATAPSGRLTYGTTAGAGEFGELRLTVPMYFKGIFRCEDLVGMDATIAADLGGNLISGTFAAGIIQFG